ncbi:MAG: 50S ribosomal protein L15 [Candidatus Poseidoniales archaeon]|nr:MAG: 50S ribosomal protein L15 [Candidatus Poseidoniales archaeon]
MVSRTNKFRGSRYHGRGKKSGRGAGKRGGRGNAGINKHRLLTRLKYMPRHWGMHGFNRHPSLRKVNISINLQELQDMVEGDDVNLGELGYDKLLGKGKMNRGMNIIVAKASARAVSKVEAAGGTVTIED